MRNTGGQKDGVRRGSLEEGYDENHRGQVGATANSPAPNSKYDAQAEIHGIPVSTSSDWR